MAKREKITKIKLIEKLIRQADIKNEPKPIKKTALEPVSSNKQEKIIEPPIIKLPSTLEEYNLLVQTLKKTKDWQSRNSAVQNMARILKAKQIFLPDGRMTKAGLTSYIKGLN